MDVTYFWPLNLYWGIKRFLCIGNKDVVIASRKIGKFEKESLNRFDAFFSKVPLPTIFQWQFGGGVVYISGDWDSWQRHFPLCNSGWEYGVIVPLFPGRFRHKYSVDGMLKVEPSKKVEDFFCGTLINFSDIERFIEEIDHNQTLREENGINYYRFLQFDSLRSLRSSYEAPGFPSHQIISINFVDSFPEIYYPYKRSSNKVFLPFSNYLNHIFFPSLKNLDLDIFLKVPILPTKIKGKVFTNFFFANLNNSVKDLNKLNKLMNLEKLGSNRSEESNFSIPKIESKAKPINWTNNPIFIFFSKCFG